MAESGSRGEEQMPNTTCPDCGGTMQLGYTADRGDYSVAAQGFWVEGAPEMSKFLGMDAGLKIKDRARYDIVTYRCERCGLLKSYARPEDRCN
jgi:ssDNA-binding Zn-finger/Zn-ribbon topoisomerase 1